MSRAITPRLPIEPETAGEPEYCEPAEPTLRGLFGMFFRHKLLIAACVVVAGAAGAAYTLYARPVYDAGAMIRYQPERVNVPQLVELLTDDNTITTEIDVLKDRTSAVAVIDSLGLRATLLKPRKGHITALFTQLQVSPPADSGTLLFRRQRNGDFAVSRPDTTVALGVAKVGVPVTIAGVTLTVGSAADSFSAVTLHVDPIDEAVKEFESSLEVTRPERDADLIAVGARLGDPAQAAAVANLLAANVIADRQVASDARTNSAVAFLRQQEDSLSRQLRVAEDTLRAYQLQEHVIDAPQQASAEVNRLATLQANLAGARADRDALSALVTRLRHDSATGSPADPTVARRLMAYPALLADQSTAVLLGALAQVETERAQLLIRRTPADSDVRVLTERVTDLEAQLEEIASTYLQSLGDQVTSLEQEAAQFSGQLDALPAKALEVARRERDTTVLSNLSVLVQTRLKEAQVSSAGGDHSLRVVDAAVAPSKPIRPRPAINLALSLLLGMMVGTTASLLKESGDRSVRSRDDALLAGGLPVLGALPRLRLRRPLSRLLKAQGEAAVVVDAQLDPARERSASAIASLLVTRPGIPGGYTESLHQLYVNLALSAREHPVKTVVFTSPLPGEGKTLSAINFALVGASRGLRVLLIDGDLRCGVVSATLALKRSPGLAEALAGQGDVKESVQRLPLGDLGSLFVLASGALPGVPGRLLTLERVRALLGVVVPRFDFVVIDTPPINLLADAELFASVSDAVLLVARAGHTQAADLRFATERLAGLGASIIGTLLNDIDLRRNTRDDGSYRYLAEAGRYVSHG